MNYKIQKYRLLNRLTKYDGLLAIFKKYNVMICGGAILSSFMDTVINDYDVYFRNDKDCTNFIEEIKSKGFKLGFSSNNAVSFENRNGVKIQAITNPELMGTSPFEVFKNFDFTICMGAYDFVVDDFVISSEFLNDIAQKRLNFNTGTKYPICSLIRTKKYQEKGFVIDAKNMIVLALTIKELQIDTYEDVINQILGIDTFLMYQFTEFLKESINLSDKYNFNEFINLLNQWEESYFSIKEDNNE